jgi:hypothetical protein
MHINILSNFIAYQLLHPSNSLVFLLYFICSCLIVMNRIYIFDK